MMQLRFMSADEQAAHQYWKNKEFKKWAVDYAVGSTRRPRRKGTVYVRARTADRAIAVARKEVMPQLPSGAQLIARLAGPRELGCIETPDGAARPQQ